MKTKLLFNIFGFIVLAVTFSQAQQGWKPKGPGSFGISTLAVDGSNLFAGTNCQNGCIFLSTDDGNSWTEESIGLPGFSVNVQKVDIRGSNVFAALQTSMYLSTNNGNSWSDLSKPPTPQYIKTFAFFGDSSILAGTLEDGVFYSEDNGRNWVDINLNLFGDLDVISILVKDSSIFLGTSQGIYKLNSIWERSDIGIPAGTNINSLATDGINIYAGTDDGIYLSTNNGAIWDQKIKGLQIDKTEFNSFAFSGTNIFVAGSGKYGGVFKSTNNGDNWSEVNTGFPSDVDVKSLVISDKYIYAGTDDNGVFRRVLSELTSSIEDDKDENSNANLSIYPNPTNGKCTVVLKINEVGTVEILCANLLGQSIFSKKYDIVNGELKSELDLSGVENGLCVIQIRYNGKTHYRKVTIID